MRVTFGEAAGDPVRGTIKVDPSRHAPTFDGYDLKLRGMLAPGKRVEEEVLTKGIRKLRRMAAKDVEKAWKAAAKETEFDYPPPGGAYYLPVEIVAERGFWYEWIHSIAVTKPDTRIPKGFKEAFVKGLKKLGWKVTE